MEYTEEQLNNFDKATLVQLFLIQQSQLQDIDKKLQINRIFIAKSAAHMIIIIAAKKIFLPGFFLIMYLFCHIFEKRADFLICTF